jgi:hypothetical protein
MSLGYEVIAETETYHRPQLLPMNGKKMTFDQRPPHMSTGPPNVVLVGATHHRSPENQHFHIRRNSTQQAPKLEYPNSY